MQVEKKQFSVSTDSLGLFGNPANLETIWGFAREATSFDGVELLAFDTFLHPSLEEIIKQIQQAGFNVSGIHGRVGAYLRNTDGLQDKGFLNPIKAALVNNLVNNMVMSTAKLVEGYGTTAYYLLFHNLEVKSKQASLVNAVCKDALRVFVENDYTYHPRRLTDAVDTVRKLRDQGVNAQLMFDMYHAVLSPYYCDPFKIWADAISALADIRKQEKGLVGGVHIPLGLRPDDSMPFEKIKDQYPIWRDLADVLNSDGGISRRVVENQQAGLSSQLIPSKSSLIAQSARNRAIYEHLVKFEVV